MLNELASLRRRRWRQHRAGRIETLAQAERFVRTVQLALPWPVPGIELPDLLSAARGRPVARPGFRDWDEALDRVWAWKDELPARGVAFYGEAPWSRVGFVAAAVVPAFLRLSDIASWGVEEAVRRGLLSPLALSIVEVLEREGQLPTMALRRAALGAAGSRTGEFKRVLAELERGWVVGRCGTARERGAAWASTVYCLLDTIFPGASSARPRSDEEARGIIATAFLRASVWTSPARLARMFRWPLRQALGALEAAGARRLTETAWVDPEALL
ncbi:MAG: hypothetical protein AB1609_09820 [Bacillota bacterium]